MILVMPPPDASIASSETAFQTFPGDSCHSPTNASHTTRYHQEISYDVLLLVSRPVLVPVNHTAGRAVYCAYPHRARCLVTPLKQTHLRHTETIKVFLSCVHRTPRLRSTALQSCSSLSSQHTAAAEVTQHIRHRITPLRQEKHSSHCFLPKCAAVPCCRLLDP